VKYRLRNLLKNGKNGLLTRVFQQALGMMALVLPIMVLAGCRQDMHDQPRYEALERSQFFPDGRSARLPVQGTVARGHLKEDQVFYTGKQDGKLVQAMPVNVDRQLLARGRERFNIYCSPCHGTSGMGNGMIVQRGFRSPPAFHTDRLRQAPAGHYFDVITNGFGAMYSYASRVEPRDRWAIIAYIRALQVSQTATLADVPEKERTELERQTEGQQGQPQGPGGQKL